MAVEATETDDGIHELSPAEAHQLFDEAARLHLDMSGDEFIRKYDSGYWPDPDADGDVMYLAMLRQIVH